VHRREGSGVSVLRWWSSQQIRGQALAVSTQTLVLYPSTTVAAVDDADTKHRLDSKEDRQTTAVPWPRKMAGPRS
jgi:hypothetical protein